MASCDENMRQSKQGSREIRCKITSSQLLPIPSSYFRCSIGKTISQSRTHLQDSTPVWGQEKVSDSHRLSWVSVSSSYRDSSFPSPHFQSTLKGCHVSVKTLGQCLLGYVTPTSNSPYLHREKIHYLPSEDQTKTSSYYSLSPLIRLATSIPVAILQSLPKHLSALTWWPADTHSNFF